MVSLPLAKKLKKIGTPWDPKANDYFAIPDRGFDERVFVISEMMTNIEQIHGRSVVTFHGGAEWAMDYLREHVQKVKVGNELSPFSLRYFGDILSHFLVLLHVYVH